MCVCVFLLVLWRTLLWSEPYAHLIHGWMMTCILPISFVVFPNWRTLIHVRCLYKVTSFTASADFCHLYSFPVTALRDPVCTDLQELIGSVVFKLCLQSLESVKLTMAGGVTAQKSANITSQVCLFVCFSEDLDVKHLPAHCGSGNY